MKDIVKFLLLPAVLLFFTGANHSVFASPGSLDLGFGSNGKVKTVFPAQTTTFRPRSGIAALAIQPDGKIVAAGYAFFLFDGTAVAPAFAVTRYNRDGSLDSSFGNGGKVTTYFNGYEQASIVALQPDGKIVVGGFTDLGGNNFAFALARYNSNGSLDNSFDGDGKLVRDITPVYDLVSGLAIQPDGKIIAAGYANGGYSTDFATMRFNADGTNDSGFGTNGLVRTDFAGTIDGGSRVVLLSNGKIVVAGSVFDNSGANGDFALVGYNADGSLDASFGTNGKVRTDFNNMSDNGNDMTLTPDGKIVVCGYSGPSGAYDSAVARYNPNGSLDTTFDGDGKFVVDLSGIGTIDGANGVAVQQNGKIVIVGRVLPSASAPHTTPFELVAARINANGGLDSSFGSGGKVFTDFNDILPNNFNATNDEFGDVVIQPDGKIIAGGEIEDQTRIEYDMALARYEGDAVTSVRRTFSDFDGDGKADVSVFRSSDRTWYLLCSTTGFSASQFGSTDDMLAPADFDGDGKTDIAVFRNGIWYWLNSSNGSFNSVAFGQAGDISVPADYMGDGRSELAVFRSGTWYILNLVNQQFQAVQFGASIDKPAAADYDGDGKIDIAVVRQTGGVSNWYILGTSRGFYGLPFGTDTDKLVPADYDGDGKADVAVYRGGSWFVQASSQGFYNIHFGASSDVPAAADYDGDGKTDIAVYRDGIWFQLRSQQGFGSVQFGTTNDQPIPTAFVP